MLTAPPVGVAAEEGALRALQHLDPLDVEQGHAEALRAAEIDAVDIDADTRVAAGLVPASNGSDAANADDERGAAREEGRDAQRRHAAVHQILKALDVTVRDALRAEDGDGDRGLLQVRLALLRGDDDVDQAPRPRLRGRLRLRMSRHLWPRARA